MLLGVGDGDISSETELDPEESAALKGERAPVVAEFAASNGYSFTVEDLITVVDAFQQHQSGQLSDNDFAKMLGLEVSASTTGSRVKNPLQRLTCYLSKTYLGVDLTAKS